MNTQAIGSDRIRRLQAALQRRGVAAMICMKPENSFYLSGFNPVIYSHPVVAVLPASGDPAVLVHALRDDHARSSAWVSDIRLYGAWGTKETMGPNWLAALGEILRERGVLDGKLGIEEDFLPIARMKQFAKAFPDASFADISDVIREARLIKEDYELECLRIAAALGDAGMQAAITALGDGADEQGVTVAAMAAMNQAWVSDYPEIEVCDFGSLEGGVHNGLWCWCLSGKRVAINTDNPKPIKPQQGEIALVFIWTNCNCIHSEVERAVAIGALGREQKAAYDSVLEIRSRIRPMLKPGVAVADLYLAAKEEYVRLGYGKYVPGRIGHGMGLGAHEEPSVDANSKIVLAPNMVLTFEPNLRIPEWGGLQHSDTVVITENGCEFLSRVDNGFLQV